MNRPSRVNDARYAGDIGALRAMGRVGARESIKARSRRREIANIHAEREAERRRDEEFLRLHEANEDICPLD